MTDDLRLLDDPLDDDVRELLLGLDRGTALRVDVDDVIARGARRRHWATVERVAAVAATVALVAGAAVFAVGRSAPAPTPGPQESPTVRPLAPSVQDWAWYELGDPRTQTGLAVASVKNTSTEPVTVLAPEVTGMDGVQAVLTEMVPADPAATVIGLSYLKRLDRPAPQSVVLLPGRSLLVVMAVPAACGPFIEVASTTVTLPLRSASGVAGRFTLGAKAGMPQSWEQAARKYACS